MTSEDEILDVLLLLHMTYRWQRVNIIIIISSSSISIMPLPLLFLILLLDATLGGKKAARYRKTMLKMA